MATRMKDYQITLAHWKNSKKIGGPILFKFGHTLIDYKVQRDPWVMVGQYRTILKGKEVNIL